MGKENYFIALLKIKSFMTARENMSLSYIYYIFE